MITNGIHDLTVETSIGRFLGNLAVSNSQPQADPPTTQFIAHVTAALSQYTRLSLNMSGSVNVSSTLQNENANCWNACGRIGGACPGFCGAAGACCRRGMGIGDILEVCDGGNAGCAGMHCCVVGVLPEPPPQVAAVVIQGFQATTQFNWTQDCEQVIATGLGLVVPGPVPVMVHSVILDVRLPAAAATAGSNEAIDRADGLRGVYTFAALMSAFAACVLIYSYCCQTDVKEQEAHEPTTTGPSSSTAAFAPAPCPSPASGALERVREDSRRRRLADAEMTFGKAPKVTWRSDFIPTSASSALASANESASNGLADGAGASGSRAAVVTVTASCSKTSAKSAACPAPSSPVPLLAEPAPSGQKDSPTSPRSPGLDSQHAWLEEMFQREPTEVELPGDVEMSI